jgi:hypothetical protein
LCGVADGAGMVSDSRYSKQAVWRGGGGKLLSTEQFKGYGTKLTQKNHLKSSCIKMQKVKSHPG